MQAQPSQPRAGSRKEGKRKRDDPMPENSSQALQSLRRHGGAAMSVSELLQHASEFARDSIGSKCLQNFLEASSTEGKQRLAQTLMHDVLKLANHPHGCRVVQKVLEEVPTDTQVSFSTA